MLYLYVLPKACVLLVSAFAAPRLLIRQTLCSPRSLNDRGNLYKPSWASICKGNSSGVMLSTRRRSSPSMQASSHPRPYESSSRSNLRVPWPSPAHASLVMGRGASRPSHAPTQSSFARSLYPRRRSHQQSSTPNETSALQTGKLTLLHHAMKSLGRPWPSLASLPIPTRSSPIKPIT